MSVDALTAKVSATLQLHVEKTQTGISNTTNDTTLTKAVSFTKGTGANGADELYSTLLTIGAGGNTVLDLAGSGLTNPVGDTNITFAKVRAIFVQLLSAADDSVNGNACTSITVGNTAANQFLGPFGAAAHTLTIPNGGFVLLGRGDATGWAVTAGTADLLKILNNDGGVAAKVRIVILGSAT